MASKPLSWRNTLIETPEINSDEQIWIANCTTKGSSRFSEETHQHFHSLSSKFSKLMKTFERYEQAFERYDQSFKSYVAETKKIVENSAVEFKSIPTESEKVINEDLEEEIVDVYQLFEEIPQKTEIGGTVCEIVKELEENAVDVYQVFDEMPMKKLKNSSNTLSANHSEQCISIDYYRGMMLNDDYLQLIAEKRFVGRYSEMLLPPPEPPDITSLGGERLINNEEYLFTAPIHVVIHASQLLTEFLQHSIVRQLVRVFNFDGVDRCCHETLCIMQFLDVVYMFDFNMGEETLVESCKPALESSYIITVIHDCIRDSEALHFQFGIKLHNIVDNQIAYSWIKDQEGQILHLNCNGSLASLSMSMVFSSVLRTRLLKKEGSNVKIQEEEGVEVIAIKPLIKSDMRSTLFLLNQVTGKDIFALVMTKIEVSLIYFVDLPSLVPRLIKAIVDLLAKRGSALLSACFFVILDVYAMFNSSHFDICLSKTFVAFVSRCGVTDLVIMKHMLLLRGGIVESCSLNIQISSIWAAGFVSAQILRLVVQTKKNKVVKEIFSRKYVNSYDPCFEKIAGNVQDYNLQPLFIMIVQIIKGVAHMFPGRRYFTLRLKCIEWLNGTFIFPDSLVLDILEHKRAKEGKKAQTTFNFVLVLEFLKHYQKMKNFQDKCFHSASEQLALHFTERSYCISFPYFAIVPLISLRNFHEITCESLHYPMNFLIEHVELEHKNRQEVSFYLHAHQLIESILQLEKPLSTLCLLDIRELSWTGLLTFSLSKCGYISLLEKRNVKRTGTMLKRKTLAANSDINADFAVEIFNTDGFSSVLRTVVAEVVATYGHG